LSPWADEVPVDDPAQPLGTDQRTLRAILRSAWNQTHGQRMIHIGGFPPWDKKYTNYPGAGGKHGGVATEWQYAYIVSCFNGYMEPMRWGWEPWPMRRCISIIRLNGAIRKNCQPHMTCNGASS
ncbi:hypothetical protein B2A_04950, partial [mine drainage metagenome]